MASYTIKVCSEVLLFGHLHSSLVGTGLEFVLLTAGTVIGVTVHCHSSICKRSCIKPHAWLQLHMCMKLTLRLSQLSLYNLFQSLPLQFHEINNSQYIGHEWGLELQKSNSPKIMFRNYPSKHPFMTSCLHTTYF